MFAATRQESSKSETVAARGNASAETTTAGSAKVNPLWQSLAMRSGTLQAKLTVGRVNDPYECEADRVADQVMRMPTPQSDGPGLSITPATSHQTQRKCDECEEEDETLRRNELSCVDSPATAPLIVHETMSSPWQPLDAGTRAFFEPRFGRDFSDVRVHTNAKAAKSTAAVNAQAYTAGRDVVFGEGQYQPLKPAWPAGRE